MINPQDETRPLLQSLKDRAIERHRLQDHYVDGEIGKMFPYTTLIASQDVIVEYLSLGGDIDELFRNIRQQTKFIPDDIRALDSVTDSKNWNQFLKDTCMWIINQEIEDENKSLNEIDRQRHQEYEGI